MSAALAVAALACLAALVQSLVLRGVLVRAEAERRALTRLAVAETKGERIAALLPERLERPVKPAAGVQPRKPEGL